MNSSSIHKTPTTASNITSAHSRHKISASRLSVPSGGGDYVSNSTNLCSSTMTPSEYLSRLTDISQMDLQSALDQMKSLLSLSPSQTQKVYKMAYYRKQTKNHWARDDPAFAALQVAFLGLSSLAYCIAFRGESILSSSIRFGFHSIFINYIMSGVIIATITRTIANQHLNVQNSYSSSHVRQNVEWLYAFDIHCNAFFPAFVLLYGVQFFLLKLVLGQSLVSLSISNTLYAAAGGWYFYVTHLGYRALPFLSNTEVFLFPIVGICFIYILNFVGYPFGFGWNASRIVAHVYFDA